MILCIAPSPAIDRTARVEHFAEGTVLRPLELIVLPGGKAITAARVAHALGAIVATTGYAGGHGGRWIVEALAGEGLNPRFVETALEARTTSVLLDRRGRSLLLYEPTSPVSPAEVEALEVLLQSELLPAADFVVLAGSFPTGSGPDAPGVLVRLARSAGRPCLVDTSGPALLSAAAAQPDVIKISLEEALGAELASRSDGRPAEVAAVRLVEIGAGLAVVTDGPRGAVACAASGLWRISVPPVAASSAVGSGDAFSAGLAVALAEGRAVEEALAAGAAAGTANALSIGGGRLAIATYQEVLGKVTVERIRPPGSARSSRP